MSTQSPLKQPPAQCSTNWLTRLACKAQAWLDPLCKKRENFKLETHEQNLLYKELKLIDDKFFAFSLEAPDTALNILTSIAWWQCDSNQTIVLSSDAKKILAPRLTVFNRIGLSLWKAFSIGTECSCCHGWRVLFVALTAGIAGYLLG